MLKPIFITVLSFFLPFSGSFNLFNGFTETAPKQDTGILEKMIPMDGTVKMDIDFNRLNGTTSRGKLDGPSSLRFDIEQNSFFTVMVFDGELRGPVPSGMALEPKDQAIIPATLQRSYDNLMLEKAPWDQHFELVIRDGKSGFRFFNIEGHQFGFNTDTKQFEIREGRILIAPDFAAAMGRSEDSGMQIGTISVTAKMRAIEIIELVDGQVKSDKMPALNPENGTNPGPDVIVGDVYGLAEFGRSGTQVGLAVGTNSCNFGEEDLHWNRLPSNDHPVIPQNMYRMSGGASNTERFEQIGQSSVKHAFTALTGNICNLGCNGVGGSRLGSGCSDPYSAGLNAGPNLGSRAWINPFDGAFPRGDSGTSPNTHSGHSHSGTSHRVLTEINDLKPSMNPGATYYAEGQYITPHEYDWCQSNPGECNMYNNVSYRQYNVSESSSFSFSPAANTVRMKPAIQAWTGATFVQIEPDPGNDGIGTVAYKVTETSPGTWHYEYVVYNQNLDRGVQSFSIPVANGVTLSNVGFHAPPQHPGSANDGTMNDAGYSSTPWTQNQTATNMEWSSETFAQNQNANAIRWGTMYNFRFDSNSPPVNTDATIGFFKAGAPITVAVQGPSASTVSLVSISGRVTSGKGRGMRGVTVSVSGAGFERTVMTNHFGNYRMSGITAGDTYTVSAFSKGIIFTPQVMQIDNNLTGIDFSPAP